MKRNYLKPESTVVSLELQQMIAMSIVGTTDQTSNNFSRFIDGNFDGGGDDNDVMHISDFSFIYPIQP
ncbi:MAG: hypothetical protein IJ551_01300 [Prevotella sp.]|nr:hypothetical protein [Prevotella sp.]